MSSIATATPAQAAAVSSVSAPTPSEQPLSGATSNASIWVREGGSRPQQYPTLKDHAGRFDVVVIGAGIVGVTSAYLLKKAGKRVALVEGRRIGCGTTGSSTCKITSQQTLIYTSLISKYGKEVAKLYGEMNEGAITQVEQLVNELKLDCDFSRKSHATWTSEESKVSDVEKEVQDAKSLGLPAELLRAQDLELPESIGVKAAIRFPNQGEFNAYKYCVELAKHVNGDGCQVYEGTLVMSIDEGTPHTIKSDESGGQLQGDHVILATHLPIMDRSTHFTMLPPSKSHVVALQLLKGDGTLKKVGEKQVSNMYINCDSEKRSIRTLHNESILVVSGESFETGDETDVEHRYKSLEDWAHKHFQCGETLTRWSAMDYYSSTILPYIGRLYRGSDTIYTATGMSKWGLGNGVAAAQIFRDQINGVKNVYEDMVDARRWDLVHAAPGMAMENWHTGKHFISDKIKSFMAPDITTLKPGEGGLVKAGGERVGAYLDLNGKYHVVEPVCTHLGCHVIFNKTDRTWDCPCHGSQYDINGTVIHGPACKNLCKRDDLKW